MLEEKIEMKKQNERGAVVVSIVVVVGLLAYIFAPALVRHHQQQECKQMVAQYGGTCGQSGGQVIRYTKEERGAL